MSRLVKDRKLAKRQTLTLNKVVNAVTMLKQKEAKNNPVEKARQQFQASLAYRPLGVYRKGDE